MMQVTVTANNKASAISECKRLYGWTPDAVRRVDSGGKKRAYRCYESAADARLADKQR